MPKTNFYQVGPSQLDDQDEGDLEEFGFEWVVYWFNYEALDGQGWGPAGEAVGLKDGMLYAKDLDINTQDGIFDGGLEHFPKMTLEEFWQVKDDIHQFDFMSPVKEMVESLLLAQRHIDQQFISAPSEAWAL
jgi:hypothetical protein